MCVLCRFYPSYSSFVFVSFVLGEPQMLYTNVIHYTIVYKILIHKIHHSFTECLSILCYRITPISDSQNCTSAGTKVSSMHFWFECVFFSSYNQIDQSKSPRWTNKTGSNKKLKIQQNLRVYWCKFVRFYRHQSYTIRYSFFSYYSLLRFSNGYVWCVCLVVVVRGMIVWVNAWMAWICLCCIGVHVDEREVYGIISLFHWNSAHTNSHTHTAYVAFHLCIQYTYKRAHTTTYIFGRAANQLID